MFCKQSGVNVCAMIWWAASCRLLAAGGELPELLVEQVLCCEGMLLTCVWAVAACQSSWCRCFIVV
jgi:hypothetical protein